MTLYRDFDDNYESWYDTYGERAFEGFISSLVSSKSFGEGLYDYSTGHLESDIIHEFIQALYTDYECITALSLRCEVLSLMVDNKITNVDEWTDLIYRSDNLQFIFELLDSILDGSFETMNGKLSQLASSLYDECENEFFETIGKDKFVQYLEAQRESYYEGLLR